MADFYREILAGKPGTQALRETKLRAIRRDPGSAKPYSWSAFVLIGEDGHTNATTSGRPEASRGMEAFTVTVPGGLLGIAMGGGAAWPRTQRCSAGSRASSWRRC